MDIIRVSSGYIGGQIGKCFAFSLFSILPAIYVLYAGRDILMDGIIIKGMED